VRKSVQPKYAEENHFNDHARRVVFDGRSVISAASSLFSSADASFDVRYVFVYATDVEFRPKVSSYGTACAFELAVGKDVVDSESALPVDTIDAFQRLDQ
jgi:hypothetical protein